MKSKNVIVLLMSLTLSLVMNAMPSVERDIGLVRGSPESKFSLIVVDYDYPIVFVKIVDFGYEPVSERTGKTEKVYSEAITLTTPVICSKCRDVDLQGSVKTYIKNITASTRPRSNIVATLYDGGGGSGNEI